MIKRFNRYEIKYRVSVAEMRQLIGDFRRFTIGDDHGATGGFYRVASLYFDTPELDCYRNKIDGLWYRRKLRVRVYPDAPDDVAFVEIKQRVDRTVQKRRLPLTLDDAYRLCRGESMQLSCADDQAVADEVVYLVRSLGLTPRNVVAYTRLAFVGTVLDLGLRLTFDTMVRTRRAGFDLHEPRGALLAYPANQAILEVKANERIPHWLITVLGRHDCDLDRISKYCHGIARIVNQERAHAG